MAPCVTVRLFSYGNHIKWYICELRKARLEGERKLVHDFFSNIKYIKFITQTKCTSTNIVSNYATKIIPMLIIFIFKKAIKNKSKSTSCYI
jgi:hypothetical protein